MGLHREVLAVTANASGAGTTSADNAHVGFLFCVEYVKNNFDDAVDLTLNALNSTGTDQIFAISNFTASARWYPRGDSVTAAGTVNTGAADMLIPFAGKLSATVAQAGNATTGTFIVWWLD